MKMFDGQHLRRAIKDILTDAKMCFPKRAAIPKISSLKEEPVMLVEDSIEALQQMFADAAQRPVERCQNQ